MATARYALGLSGFLGILVGLTLGLYQTILLDPLLLGARTPESMVVSAHIHFNGLSLIVLVYTLFVDDLFPNRGTPIAIAAIFGQWTVPGVLLVILATGIMPLMLLTLLGAIAFVAVALLFVIRYAQEGPLA